MRAYHQQRQRLDLQSADIAARNRHRIDELAISPKSRLLDSKVAKTRCGTSPQPGTTRKYVQGGSGGGIAINPSYS
ncbi:hypothetical protein [Novosphingobium sp.]|uniref:hypothetical protein n=1 Tax=Novosphingobium sp. TaxID=1874826 RepID=UPI0038B8BA12